MISNFITYFFLISLSTLHDAQTGFRDIKTPKLTTNDFSFSFWFIIIASILLICALIFIIRKNKYQSKKIPKREQNLNEKFKTSINIIQDSNLKDSLLEFKKISLEIIREYFESQELNSMTNQELVSYLNQMTEKKEYFKLKDSLSKIVLIFKAMEEIVYSINNSNLKYSKEELASTVEDFFFQSIELKKEKEQSKSIIEQSKLH